MYFIIYLFHITFGKGEVHPTTCHTGPEQKQRYNSYSFFNLDARYGGGGQRHAMAALPPGKQTQYSLSYYLMKIKIYEVKSH